MNYLTEEGPRNRPKKKEKKKGKKKPCLVWQVADMASNNKGFLRTHAVSDKPGNPTNNTFTWAAEKNRAERSVRDFLRAPPSPCFCLTFPCTLARWGIAAPAQLTLLRKFGVQIRYTLCVCVFLFSCVCMNESSRSDPTLRGRLIWLGVLSLCQSACLRQKCSHNRPLCSKCHSFSEEENGSHRRLFFFFFSF